VRATILQYTSHGDDDRDTGRRADVADRVFLERVRRVHRGHDVQPVRTVVLGVGAGVWRDEHGHHAVERVRAGRLVRRPLVHHVPAAVHQAGGVHLSGVPGDHRVQGVQTLGRFQGPGVRVRTPLAHFRVAQTSVPALRVVRGCRVPGHRLARQPVAAVPAVQVRGVW